MESVKRQLPDQFGVFEKEARICSIEFPIILGPYWTREEAEIAGKKYGYWGENYYVDVIRKIDGKR